MRQVDKSCHINHVFLFLFLIIQFVPVDFSHRFVRAGQPENAAVVREPPPQELARENQMAGRVLLPHDHVQSG